MLTQVIQGKLNLLALAHAYPDRYPFLLESVAYSSNNRYSLLFAHPQQTICLTHLDEFNFCQTLDSAWQAESSTELNAKVAHLPFRGGWFLYLGYELVGQLESSLRELMGEQELPIACAVRIPVAIVVDHVLGESTVVAEPAFEDAFNAVLSDLNAMPSLKPVSPAFSVVLTEDEPIRFLDGVHAIREYIAAGDVFQVNLSRAWRAYAQNIVSASELYQRLRQTNPAPFSCLVNFHDFAIVSSSPERLVQVNAGIVETRPIAGTRPRGRDADADSTLLQELIQHPKERAEHIMLIDLERNDMGRVCEYGSVHVNELMVLETYQHVHHIVSNIRGRLQAGVTTGQIIRAIFPGGTITGCPKVRCMEIIAELEGSTRGAYTGSVGYLNHNGDLDLNILIRTFTVQGQTIQFRTGAGIVMDSIAENELLETRHKARGLLRALNHDMD